MKKGAVKNRDLQDYLLMIFFAIGFIAVFASIVYIFYIQKNLSQSGLEGELATLSGSSCIGNTPVFDYSYTKGSYINTVGHPYYGLYCYGKNYYDSANDRDVFQITSCGVQGSDNFTAKNFFCGNGICAGDETKQNCNLDCCNAEYCGDGICNNGETSITCSLDCKVITPIPTPTPAPSDPSLVLYYKFENNAADSQGRYNGTIYGNKTFISGKFGNALGFDGYGDYVQTALPGYITNKTPITVSFWAKDLGNGAQKAVLNIQKQSGVGGQIMTCYISAVNNGISCSRLQLSATAVKPISNITKNNNWIHYAITTDGGTGRLKLYANGVEVTSAAGVLSNFGTNVIQIGKGYSSPLYDLIGTIDEFKIWNRTLSASEIMNEYTYSVPSTPSISSKLSITRKITGSNVVLSISKSAPLGENEVIMVAEEILSGTSLVSSDISPTYADSNLIVWMFSSGSEGYFGDFNLNTLPNSITYTVSGSASGIKGKWALKNLNEGGVIN